MNLLSRSLLFFRCKAPMQGPGPMILQGIRPAAVVRPPRQPRFVLRWYHEPAKAAAAAVALSAAAAMAALSSYPREIVPCTNRPHRVIFPHGADRELGEAAIAGVKEEYEGWIVDPRHPDSARVARIADRVIHAAYRGLGVYDSRDAPLLRVTADARKRRRQQRPQTRHLHGLRWEVILARDDANFAGSTLGGKLVVFTGLLRWCKTDGEIAAALAHEVGHIIARHSVDIMNNVCWVPPFLRPIFLRRHELEADYIGILLLAAAGFDPRWALLLNRKQEMFLPDSVSSKLLSTHPTNNKMLRLLSQPKVMDQALELYREATAMDVVTDRYFRTRFK